MPQGENVHKVSLFGSYLHGNAKNNSDVDLLLELKEPVGYFELARIERQFEESLAQKVDLVEPEALSKYFRDDVLTEAQVPYER